MKEIKQEENHPGWTGVLTSGMPYLVRDKESCSFSIAYWKEHINKAGRWEGSSFYTDIVCKSYAKINHRDSRVWELPDVKYPAPNKKLRDAIFNPKSKHRKAFGLGVS